MSRAYMIGVSQMKMLVKELAQKEARIEALRQDDIPNMKKEMDERVSVILDEDRELLKRMRSAKRKAENAISGRNKERVIDTFLKIFCNLRCQTREVEDENGETLKINGAKLTVGKTGFGLRWNIQSETLTKYHGEERIFDIIKNAETIAKWMDNNRMKMHADRLRRFAGYAKHISSKELVKEFSLDEKDMFPILSTDYDQVVTNVEKFTFNGEFCIPKEKKYYGNAVTIVSYSSMSGEPSISHGYAYAMIRDTLLREGPKYAELCEEIAENADENVRKLEEEFKRELCLIDI